MAHQRVLEINVAYAQGLKDVNLFTKMDVYVTVSIVGGKNNSNIKQKTNVDRDSGTHPTWNFPMRFTVDDLHGRSSLVFKLKCEGSLADTDIGKVCVPIKDLLDSSSISCESKSSKFVHYQVTKPPSGKGQGTLTFSYKFLKKVFGAQTVEPVERAAEATQQPTTYLPPQQPMDQPSLSHCGFSCQDTYYRPNTYPPQTHVPYSYPAALPEQVLGSRYVYPPPAHNSYPPPPDPTTGFVYIYPPPQSAAPNYYDAYVPYHQQPLQQLVCPPPSSGGQYDVYPYPPQADHKYGCPPQPYPGYW